jgi:hypothetical protein
MADRTGVIVRMPPQLLEKIDRRTIEAKRKNGLTWSRNDEIVALLEGALKGRSDRG